MTDTQQNNPASAPPSYEKVCSAPQRYEVLAVQENSAASSQIYHEPGYGDEPLQENSATLSQRHYEHGYGVAPLEGLPKLGYCHVPHEEQIMSKDQLDESTSKSKCEDCCLLMEFCGEVAQCCLLCLEIFSACSGD